MEKPDADPPATNELGAPEMVVDGDAVDDATESDPPPRVITRGPPPLPPSLPPQEPRASAPPPVRLSAAPPPPAGNRMLIGGAVLLVLVGVAVAAGLKVGTALHTSRAVPSSSAPVATPGASAAGVAAPTDSNAPVLAIPTVEFGN